jgi:hypothetical protein
MKKFMKLLKEILIIGIVFFLIMFIAGDPVEVTPKIIIAKLVSIVILFVISERIK